MNTLQAVEMEMSLVPRRGPGRPKQSEEVNMARKEEILKAATELFARQGYRNADLQVVADELGIGKGTIYRAFPTKQELFFAAVDRGLQRLRDHIASKAIGENDPVRRITIVINEYLGFFDENAALIELFLLERSEFRDREKSTYFQHRDRNIGEWKRMLRELVDAGRLRSVSVDAISDAMTDLLYGAVFTQYFARDKRTLQSRTDEIVDIFFNGVLSESERGKAKVISLSA
jgi:AcrR family transcriptional regulator